MEDKELDNIINKVIEMTSRHVTYFANIEKALLDEDDKAVIIKLLDKIYGLIQKNKELEIENQSYYGTPENVKYISKQKIQEKIEKLNKEYQKLENTSDFIIADNIQPKIQVLEELLEG